MRYLRYLLPAVILCASPASLAAAACSAGETVTVSGSVVWDAEWLDEQSWWFEADVHEPAACGMVTAVAGAGAPPAACSAGRRFTATGVVYDAGFGDGIYASSVGCY